jgi:valyl-tRNA synthetase
VSGGKLIDGLRCTVVMTVTVMCVQKLSAAVKEAFVRLHEKGLIYRASRLVSWSCTLRTAISNIEVNKVELKEPKFRKVPGHAKEVEFGVIHKFAYRIKGSDAKDSEIVVATTRLETMLGTGALRTTREALPLTGGVHRLTIVRSRICACVRARACVCVCVCVCVRVRVCTGDTAVAVHSKDERYKKFHGAALVHPFVPDRVIKVITDDVLVDPKFGTGAVKVTPAHDPNDYKCGTDHRLQFINILNDDGTLNEQCGKFKGMKRFEVRTASRSGQSQSTAEHG